MANSAHTDILRCGVQYWNEWKQSVKNIQNIDISNTNFLDCNFSNINFTYTDISSCNLKNVNLSNSNLHGASLDFCNFENTNLFNANLSNTSLLSTNIDKAILNGVNLSNTYLPRTNFTGISMENAIICNSDLSNCDFRYANLKGVNLQGSNIYGAKFEHANLENSILSGLDFTGHDLSGVNLSNSNLYECNFTNAHLVETNLTNSNISGSKVYGISVWNILTQNTLQTNLIITKEDESIISLDNLEMAQFIYLLLNYDKIRNFVDTITTKVVLILGRFTSERKNILDSIRCELRKYNYIPVLFDFEKPNSRDTQETITTLARLARFVIADITDPKSIPQELISIVQDLPSVPIQPIIEKGYDPWGMYDYISKYNSILPIYQYSKHTLLIALKENIITPAENKLSKGY